MNKQFLTARVDTGLRIPGDPEVPRVTDISINDAGSTTGSGIQHRSPGADRDDQYR
jgi:hypothetical protein